MVLGDGAHIMVDEKQKKPRTTRLKNKEEKQDFLSEVKNMIERKHTRLIEKKKKKQDKSNSRAKESSKMKQKSEETDSD